MNVVYYGINILILQNSTLPYVTGQSTWLKFICNITVRHKATPRLIGYAPLLKIKKKTLSSTGEQSQHYLTIEKYNMHHYPAACSLCKPTMTTKEALASTYTSKWATQI
jgi:hypothetical protein